MGVPKKRKTVSKRNQRRSHDFLEATTVIYCSNCGSKIQPHHVCMECGQYRGKTIFEVKDESATEASGETK